MVPSAPTLGHSTEADSALAEEVCEPDTPRAARVCEGRNMQIHVVSVRAAVNAWICPHGSICCLVSPEERFTGWEFTTFKNETFNLLLWFLVSLPFLWCSGRGTFKMVRCPCEKVQVQDRLYISRLTYVRIKSIFDITEFVHPHN